ncbi:50S ribosomal protein L13 [Candidatus Bathyarchaeota archaeon]|jgi:large subunit ribosomal protein L13|nr:50S ribosomal protein L13 [Candidatus Bathyarchaeota archaeon]
MSKEPVIIDASNLVLGRLASFAAKHALQGDEVIVFNAENAVISGTKANIVEEAKRRLKTRTLASQWKAPTHPRRPDTYVRRVIRGMLPRRKPKGSAALKRVRVYIGTPEEYRDKSTVKIPEAEASKLRCSYITVGELSEEIGGPWKV